MLAKTMIILSVCVVVVFTAFSIISIRSTSGALNKSITERSVYEAEKCAQQMSTVFENAEGTVDTLYAYVYNTFSEKDRQNDPEYLDKYMQDISPIISTALNDVEDAAGLYITFNSEFGKDDKAYEVWYSKTEDGKVKFTDATRNGVYYEAFSDYDAPHMQYFFSAKENRTGGVWTEPCYNPDIEADLITYSRSVYSNNVLVGVIGVDIYTTHTEEIIRNMDVQNNGQIFLLNEDNQEILSSGSDYTSSSSDFWSVAASSLTPGKTSSASVSQNGNAYLISYSTLSNGWTLAIVDKESILFARVDFLKCLIIIMAVILTILILVVAFFALNHFSSPIKKATELLEMMDLDENVNAEEKHAVKTNEDIEALVRKQIAKQRKTDLMLAHQSRLAKTGEMMASITHQWKQPLNKLSLLLGNLRDLKEYNQLTDDDLVRTIERSEELISTMSETINDFRSHLTPDSEKSIFSILRTINSVLAVTEDRLKLCGINPEVNAVADYMAYGYRNSLYHVILNVISNAIDALEDENPEEKILSIEVSDSGKPGMVDIKIFNNGGNISEEIKDSLFTPYVTTKSEKDGSGLGLAISKQLIEESMEGIIRLENYNNGVLCTITIKTQE